MDTYKAVVDQEEFSKSIAMKKLLGMTDDEIEENFRMLVKEKMQIQLADWYADKLNTEGPAIYDPPIKIKGEKEESGSEGGEEGSEGSEEAGSEEAGNEESGSESKEENKEEGAEESAPEPKGLSLGL